MYTGLALQAMTRHFGSLEEAIISQLNSVRRRFIISHQDVPKIISSGLSQLSLFDGNTTSSSLQRLGLVQGPQRHAWKPIRGLPETSVAILRAWLFQHFLHPSVFLLLKCNNTSDESKLKCWRNNISLIAVMKTVIRMKQRSWCWRLKQDFRRTKYTPLNLILLFF